MILLCPSWVFLCELLWEYAAGLWCSFGAKVWFQWSCYAGLLRSHFGVGVFLWICSVFWGHLFVGGPTEGCFCLLQRHYHHLLFILKAHLHIAITVMSMTHRFSKFYNFCWLFVTAVTFASAVFPIIEFDPNKLCFHHLEWATLRSILKSSFNNY